MKKSTSAVAEPDSGPAAEIAGMERLSQQSAAWLLGISPRSLRDHPEIRRNSDGTYSGRELVAWMRNQGGAPELSDEQYEICLRLSEEFDEDSSSAMILPIEALVKAIGGNSVMALGAIMDVILRDTRERAGMYPETFRFRSGFPDKTFVCYQCYRRRNGRRWLTGPEIAFGPNDDVIQALCPKCQRTYGRSREADE